jgi:hypothetical protein
VIVMKWMGWSYPDLLAAPDDYVRAIIPALIREAEREREQGQGR